MPIMTTPIHIDTRIGWYGKNLTGIDWEFYEPRADNAII